MYKVFIYLYVIIILFIIIFFWRFLYTKKKVLHLETKTLFRDEIKTGDIFLVDWQRFKNVLLSSLMRSSFMHPCIAVWENNDLFIVEIINYFNDDKFKGLIKVPFNKWYRINKRGLILYNKLDIDISSSEEEKHEREVLSQNILRLYMTFYIPYFVGASVASYLTKNMYNYIVSDDNTITEISNNNNV